jgi:hypothetical protein
MIEIVAPETGVLVGIAEVRGYPIGWLSEELVGTYREDANGLPYIDVWTVEVVRSSSPTPASR